MNSIQRAAHQWTVVAPLVILAMLIMALGPAWPAAAQEPADVAESDVTASAVNPAIYQVFPPEDSPWTEFLGFGQSSAISGDILVVGASHFSLTDYGSTDGVAYVFGRNVGGAGQWGLIKRLQADETDVYARFGYSVAIYGNIIVVGAPFADVDCEDCREGAAYVFERDAGGEDNWGQVARLTASTPEQGDEFGYSVAIYDNTIVVGAPNTDIYDSSTLTTYAGQGAIYIFADNGAGVWNLVKRRTAQASDAKDGLGVGAAVAIYSQTIIAGAPRADSGAISTTGAAIIFGRDQDGANKWGQVKTIFALDPSTGDLFGSAVSIGANTAVVGARSADVSGVQDIGAAYVFVRDLGGADVWGQRKKLTDPGMDPYRAALNNFGYSVAISDAAIVVAAPFDDPFQDEEGVLCIYGRDTGGANEWGLITKVWDTTDGPPGDKFEEYLGWSVAMDGPTIVGGAFQAFDTHHHCTGAAFVFTPYSLRINAGGPRYVDVAGNVWQADRPWPSQVWAPYWGYIAGMPRIVNMPIANTLDDKLYQSERLWSGQAKPGYQFVVPNGQYRLTFKYAEIYWNATGKRRFTVMAEGQTCFSNYDPFFAAGGVRYRAAPDKSCTVTVADGRLDISFISLLGQAKADAIYIQQLYK